MRYARTIAQVAALVAIYVIWRRWGSSTTWERAASTGKSYRVKRAPDAAAVAERLAALELKLRAFLEAADDAFPGDARVANIRARWNGTLSEVARPGDVAFSLNKQDVHVCVRSPGGGLEPMNTTVYILLHELAHVATDAYGHPPVFWTNFRWVLEAAERLGVYAYEDFDAVEKTYCGHVLGNNVMGCVRRKECRSLLPSRASKKM